MQILNIFHVLVAIALVAFVLIQKGQGATAGASFGAGASATVFGSRGAGNFLTKATWILAALFCAISLTMAVVVSRTVGAPQESDLGVVADVPVATEEISDVPPETPLSVSADEAGDNDLPAIELNSEQSDGDVPAFEVPDDAGAIEGSEVSDEFLDENQESAGSGDEG